MIWGARAGESVHVRDDAGRDWVSIEPIASARQESDSDSDSDARQADPETGEQHQGIHNPANLWEFNGTILTIPNYPNLRKLTKIAELEDMINPRWHLNSNEGWVPFFEPQDPTVVFRLQVAQQWQISASLR